MPSLNMTKHMRTFCCLRVSHDFCKRVRRRMLRSESMMCKSNTLVSCAKTIIALSYVVAIRVIIVWIWLFFSHIHSDTFSSRSRYHSICCKCTSGLGRFIAAACSMQPTCTDSSERCTSACRLLRSFRAVRSRLVHGSQVAFTLKDTQYGTAAHTHTHTHRLIYNCS